MQDNLYYPKHQSKYYYSRINSEMICQYQILQTKVPSLPETSCSANEIKQFLAHCLQKQIIIFRKQYFSDEMYLVIKTELKLSIHSTYFYGEHLPWLLSSEQTHVLWFLLICFDYFQ